jgi:hypothetical protein
MASSISQNSAFRSGASQPRGDIRALQAEARAHRDKALHRGTQLAFGVDSTAVASDAGRAEPSVEENRPGLLDGLFSWGAGEEASETQNKPATNGDFYTPAEIARQNEATAKVRRNGPCKQPIGGGFEKLADYNRCVSDLNGAVATFIKP